MDKKIVSFEQVKGFCAEKCDFYQGIGIDCLKDILDCKQGFVWKERGHDDIKE